MMAFPRSLRVFSSFFGVLGCSRTCSKVLFGSFLNGLSGSFYGPQQPRTLRLLPAFLESFSLCQRRSPGSSATQISKNGSKPLFFW